MDFNLLKAFDALMSERSVTRAGEKIGLTQPAMSQSLAKLRLEFRDELFKRSRLGMEPTPRAFEIYREVSAALAHIKCALSRGDSFNPLTSNRSFVIGLTEYAEIVLIEKLLNHFSKLAPHTDIRFTSISKANVSSLLESKKIDIAIGHFNKVQNGINKSLLYIEKLVCLTKVGNPALISFSHLDVESYIGLKHILMSPTGEKWGAVDKELENFGAKREVELVLSSYIAAIRILLNTDYIISVPEKVGAFLVSLAALEIWELPFNRNVEVGMLWSNRNSSDVAHMWLRNNVQAVTASM